MEVKDNGDEKKSTSPEVAEILRIVSSIQIFAYILSPTHSNSLRFETGTPSQVTTVVNSISKLSGSLNDSSDVPLDVTICSPL